MNRSARAQAGLLALLFLLVIAARLCHIHILWSEESYPTAAARQILNGKVLYRDIWFDKPPFYAMVYLLWEAAIGFALRWSGALYIVLAISVVYRFALDLWGPDEAILAAGLLGFHLTFGIPSAVMALAPDLLTVAPHAGAVYLAWKRKPFAAGFVAGLALLANPKGVFVFASCLLWQWRSLPWLLAGAAVPNVLMYLYLADNGAWGAYYKEVWDWGFLYAKATFLSNPFREGLLRTANWIGFQAAAVIGAGWYLWRERSSDRIRFLLWIAVSLAGVCAGWRFFPRYYFLLLPPIVLLGARGLMLMPRLARAAVLALLLIPLVRFGPRYVVLAQDLVSARTHSWADLAMNQDSHTAGDAVRALAKPGDTLLVWGYRTDIFAYSGLPAGTRFLDSQPLTGVLADRHLTDSNPTAPLWATANRQELLQSKPTFIVDGLGPYNPSLAISAYPDLRKWLKQYEVCARTGHSIVYRLIP